MPLNVNAILADIYAELHATGAADAVWWTDAEITRLLNDHIRHLCQNTGVNVTRDTATIVLAAGTATYALPADHLSTIAVYLDGKPLRPASTWELERRDVGLTATSSSVNPVTWWYSDKIATMRIGFYPVPSTDVDTHTVEIVYHKLICNIDEAHTVVTIALPQMFGDWVEHQVSTDAYAIESDGRAVDIAQVEAGFANLWFDIFGRYYGRAQ